MRPDEFLHILRMIGKNPSQREDLFLNSLFVELVLWAIVLILALRLVRSRPKFLENFELALRRLARRKRLAIVGTAVLALCARAALLPLIPIPEPVVHDEYSYLLQADTFASGHLTNPTHPLWVHFESFHINMWPTYQSMYPPGQASVMALAEALTGSPWWGVWLSVGLMCGAVVWMLQAWMLPEWALLGGLFCVVRFATFSYWMNSYWGGAVAAIGGCLVFGALGRLLHHHTTGNAVLLALGLVILANTRPYEGFVLSCPALIWAATYFFRKRLWTATSFTHVLAPAMAVFVLAGAGMLYYNWRSTQNPLLMPYEVNRKTYHISRPFLWQPAAPTPEYNHPVMRRFYIRHELPEYIKSRKDWGLEDMEKGKIQVYYEFFVWPLFVLSFFSLWHMLKSRRMRIVAITLLLFLACLLIEAWLPHAHYAGPASCLVLAMVLYGLRLLRTWKPHRIPLGVMMSRVMVLLVLVWTFVPLGERILNPFQLSADAPYRPAPELDRARLENQLENTPGQHLVIIHNRWSHTGSEDWIYNKADIDHTKIVWARDMGPEKNEELLRYFANRRVWLVDQNDGIMRLNAYNERTSEEIIAAAPSLIANAGTQLAASRPPAK